MNFSRSNDPIFDMHRTCKNLSSVRQCGNSGHALGRLALLICVTVRYAGTYKHQETTLSSLCMHGTFTPEGLHVAITQRTCGVVSDYPHFISPRTLSSIRLAGKKAQLRKMKDRPYIFRFRKGTSQDPKGEKKKKKKKAKKKVRTSVEHRGQTSTPFLEFRSLERWKR